MSQGNELTHYGVKGMRWGKRKSLPPPSMESSPTRDYSKVGTNRERTTRQLQALATLSQDYNLEVYVRPRSKGRADFMIESRDIMNQDQANVINQAFNKSMNEVHESLRRDGYKIK